MEQVINKEQDFIGEESSETYEASYQLAQNRMKRSPLCNWKKENETPTSNN